MRTEARAAAGGLAGCLILLLAAAAAWGQAGRPAAPGVILDENAAWRRYYRFCPNRISPALLKAGGDAALGPNRLDRLKKMAEKWMAQEGGPAGGADWRDHAILAEFGPRSFNPTLAGPPPKDWAATDFDDAEWVRLRTPFQGGTIPQITTPVLGQYDETVDLKLHQAFYRARFLVPDPATAGAMTVQVAYAGGVRVLLNGQEIARGHLPKGELADEDPAADYLAAAYGPKGESASRRTTGSVAVPAAAIKKGANVLAIELRASDLNPVVMTNPDQPNWGGPTRPWPHTRLFSVVLKSGGPPAADLGEPSRAAAVPSCVRRPAGVQAWAEDMHYRTLSSDFLPPGEAPGTVRMVAARNAQCSAQVVVGTDKPLAGVEVRCGELSRAGAAGGGGGGAALPAQAVEVLTMLPFPLPDWSMAHLGDERGLGANFPRMADLARQAGGPFAGQVALFDQIASSAAPARPVFVPAGTARPFWLRVTVPKDAAPGTYAGKVEVLEAGKAVATLPVELEVVDWAMPDRSAWQTYVGCEENPYAVARQYGVKLWSPEHFRLLEASFRQLARVGGQWLNVPILARGEFGNGEDSMVRWVRAPDGGWTFDFAVLDKYLTLASKQLGRIRVVQFVVEHGMKPSAVGLAPGGGAGPQVPLGDKAGGRGGLLAVGETAGPAAKKAWAAFGAAVYARMKNRGLEKAMYWGAPWEGEAEPTLKTILAEAVPAVFWTAGPHEMMYNGTYAKDEKFYRLVTDIRYQGGWPSFREDEGWRSKTPHLLNPRAGGTGYAMHTTSYPFAYRVMVDRALAKGWSGFGRVGADDWAATHYDGMAIPRWLTGMPVLFVLWPGPDGATSSARFEALIEGVQEAEARIFLEKGGAAKATLARHFQETNICQGNSIIHSIEQYDHAWQARSRRLLTAAAEASGKGTPVAK
jgi:hypothetical protein